MRRGSGRGTSSLGQRANRIAAGAGYTIKHARRDANCKLTTNHDLLTMIKEKG